MKNTLRLYVEDPISDYRVTFIDDYTQMNARLMKQNKRVPFTLADAMVLMFSDNQKERAFMIRLWYEIEEASQSEIYSTDLIDDPEKPNGPQIFDVSGKYP